MSNLELDPALEGAEPRPLWEIFDEIRKIPRPSGKEGAVLRHLTEFAGKHGFETREDKKGNICIHVPATPGYEEETPICLQGHADMVTVQVAGGKHDFDNDPIQLQRDGDLLKAKDTTLGSDNGVGISAALAVALDKDAIHPRLEILVTRNEEDGMSGAENLDPVALEMSSTKVLNLDTEHIGEVFISSAGFLALQGKRKLDREAAGDTGEGFYKELKISGMPGGHSGVNIHETERGNAILSMGAFLATLPEGARLVSIDGGQAINAIPAEAKAIVFFPKSYDLSTINDDAIQRFAATLNVPGIRVSFESLNPGQVERGLISANVHRQIVEVLQTVPNGVNKMSPAVDGLVQTSSNLGRIETTDDDVTLGFAIRSDVGEEMDAVGKDIEGTLSANGFETKYPVRVPGWQGDPNASVVKAVTSAYEEVAGTLPSLKGVHGGLETGFIIDKLTAISEGKKVEAVSFGPTITNAHSPTEAVSISSTEIFYQQLKAALRRLTLGEVN